MFLNGTHASGVLLARFTILPSESEAGGTFYCTPEACVPTAGGVRTVIKI
jgi:hypothetical protein